MTYQQETFNFTLFEPRRAKMNTVDEPSVELRPNGRIVFNKKASALLNDHHFCMLGYDEQNKALGIMPVPEVKNNCFPVRYATKGAYIGAKKFFKYFNILPGELIKNTPFPNGEFIGIKL